MEGNKFYLYSLADVIYNSKTNDYRLISFTTRMDSIATDYYLKDIGMEIMGKFGINDTILNIKVMLTKQKDSATTNKVVIDFTKENIRNLKLSDIIDFHIFTSGVRQQQRKDCPQFITK